jgi:ribosomal protein S18 acetylase RimI-like enzyme
MLRTFQVTPDDDAFLYRLYERTRMAEVTAWGWDEAAVNAFLQMQWSVQQKCYQNSYPQSSHRVIAFHNIHVGRILLGYHDQAILLIDISVLPEYRNQGIGDEMLRSLQREAAEAAKTVRLNVLKQNPAKRLYERLGFKSNGGSGIYESMEWVPTRIR